MNKNNSTKNTNAIWTTFGIVIFLLLLIVNIHLWSSPKKVKVDKSGEAILLEVGMGKTDPKKLKLTPTQIIEIATLIIKNPKNYNASQKALITRKTGQNILTEIGTGLADPKKIKLTPTQLLEIKKLIESNPNDYNAAQKSVLNLK